MRARFGLGVIVATPGALGAIRAAGQTPTDFLKRHAWGDWGDVDAHDAKENERAMREGERLLSSYKTKNDEKIWIITEADRSSTCLLLPEEY
jgi:hypothetical protein